MEDIKPIKKEVEDTEYNSHQSYIFFAGTKPGILKGINPGNEKIEFRNFPRSEKIDRDDEITALAWRNVNKTDVLVGHANKTVSLFDTTSSSYIFRFPLKFGKGKVVDIVRRLQNIYVGIESGHVGVLFKEEKGVVTTFDTLRGAKFHQQKYKPNLCCIKADPVHESKISTGGCENDLKIWDVNASKKLVFCAKNVPHDMLDLRVPIWVSDMTYLNDQKCIAVVSRHKCVRLYDPRTKGRPIMNIKYEDSPITCVTTVPQRDHNIVFGTAHGRVTLFDIRKKIHNRAPVVFKKIDGAIKKVGTTEDDPSTVFSVSLDRYFRVHDLDSKQTIKKEYLKSKLTTLLV